MFYGTYTLMMDRFKPDFLRSAAASAASNTESEIGGDRLDDLENRPVASAADQSGNAHDDASAAELNSKAV